MTNVLQPAVLTQVLEYSNLLFTILFAVEMLLKIVADGPIGYIRDGFNVFDGFIVVLRYTDCGTSRHCSLEKPFSFVQLRGICMWPLQKYAPHRGIQ